MARAQSWIGFFLVAIPFAFTACGDDEDDGGGSGDGKGGEGGEAGSAVGGASGTLGGMTTAGRGGAAGSTSGRGGASGRGGTAGASTGGEGGAGMGGMGGEEGGMGGEAGETQGGTAGMSGSGGALGGMSGKGGAGAGGAGSGGGGVGGAGAGGAGAGGGGAGAGGGGAGGAGAGGGGAGGAGAGGAGMGGAGMGGAGMAGMAGAGGTAPTCDPSPAPQWFVGEFSGGQEVPVVISSGTGFAVAELNPAETELTVSFYWSGLTSNTTAAHVHGPAPVGVGGAGIIFPLTVPTPTSLSGEVVGAMFSINEGQVAQLRQGLYYGNVHSVNNTGGELRAQLVPATAYRAGTLSGAQEVPPVTSSGTGRAVVAVFPNNAHAAVSVSWSGLTTGTHLGHIHGPAPAGTPAGVLFNLDPVLGNTSGSVIHKIWTFTGAHSANLLGNLTYANIHSTMYMGGELRGQLLPPCN